MPAISRREFGSLAGSLTFVLAESSRRLFAAPNLDVTLRESMTRRKIPTVVAMVATPDKITYAGAFGPGVKANSIFAIASMTKAITATAALQLVERGKVKLDEPVSNISRNCRNSMC
jgi:CubicO group peptidase (beta-lactamase class C family)